MSEELAPWEDDKAACLLLLEQSVAIHLNDYGDKFNFLTYSAQKLMALVANEISPESVDNPMVFIVLHACFIRSSFILCIVLPNLPL